MIANELGVSISTKINPEYVRPNDNRVVVGSNEKIRKDNMVKRIQVYGGCLGAERRRRP